MSFIPGWARNIILKLILIDLKRKINREMRLELEKALPHEKKMILEKFKVKKRKQKEEFNKKSSLSDDDFNLL